MKTQALNMRRHRLLFYFFLCNIAVISGVTSAGELESDWPLYGRTLDNQRFSPLNQVSTDNVQHLELAWKFRTGRSATFQTSPIVIDGVMYITTPFNDIIALDATTGTMLWRYEHELELMDFCCGPANRGPAVKNGKVYSVTVDARVVALDQSTGKLLWETSIIDTAAGNSEELTALLGVSELKGAVKTGFTGYSANLAPQVFDGKLFVGITGAGYGIHLNIDEDGEQILSVGGLSGGGHGLRGFMVAYDIETGREIWRWYSVPENGWEGKWSESTEFGARLNRQIEEEKQAWTDYSDTWRYGGGSIYTTPAIDPELGLVYFGTGNPSPQMDDSTRPGDNLYTASLVALDLKTGKLRWHYQQVPHDRWGYDVASPPILFDLIEKGKKIRAIGQASKLGWFFIHDRESGRLIRKSTPFIRQDNLFARPDDKGVRIVPGTLGAVSWSPVSFHPELNRVYIPAIFQPSMFYTRSLEPEPGRPWKSFSFFRKSDEPDYGMLVSIDVNTGELAWQRKISQPMVGGTLVTAGDLLFTGEGNGNFDAYNAINGKLLWQYRAEFGVNAPPVSYMLDGHQYIAVAAGGNRLFGYSTGDEILVFRLPD